MCATVHLIWLAAYGCWVMRMSFIIVDNRHSKKIPPIIFTKTPLTDWCAPLLSSVDELHIILWSLDKMVIRLVPFLFAPNCVFLDLIFNEKYINETKNSDSPDSNSGPIIALNVFILWLKSKLIEVPNYFFYHTQTHTHILTTDRPDARAFLSGVPWKSILIYICRVLMVWLLRKALILYAWNWISHGNSTNSMSIDQLIPCCHSVCCLTSPGHQQPSYWVLQIFVW